MLSCFKCGKEFKPGMVGWMARFEGPPNILPGSPLKKLLICPEDYAKLEPGQKAIWHEYIDPPKSGPTREKRPGHLGTEPVER